jgi:hypothetical protein
MKINSYGYDRRGFKISPPINKRTYMSDLVVGKIEQLTNEFPKINIKLKEDEFLKWLIDYKNDIIKGIEEAKESNDNSLIASYAIKLSTCSTIEFFYHKLNK